MDNHYRVVELPITIDDFHRLPRNAAYKYEYFGGRAVLTPRPKPFGCVRDLGPVEVDPDPADAPTISLLTAADAREMASLFSASLRQTQPFASLDDETARSAAAACLEQTLTGGDGPLVETACFRATADGHPVGGILVTLVPEAVLTDPFAGNWKEPPPPDAVERRLGVPHLTWVFVHPWETRRGIGSALLAASVRALGGMGFTQLASAFLLDNGPSALWHWRHGFRLLPHFSAIRQKVRARFAARMDQGPA